MNKSLLIEESKSILDALSKLNEVRDVSRLILFVVDSTNRVVGSLTDGDIRRSLVQHKDMNIRLGEVCNRNFVRAIEGVSVDEFEEYRKADIKILPVLDKDQRLKKLIDLGVQKSILPLNCVIMAGGRGKRLSPLTDNLPKPMLPLGGKPIIQHNLERIASYGVKNVFISVKYLSEKIENYFGNGEALGLNIEYIHEDRPLGTAGALSRIPKSENDYLMVMNSDLLTDVDLERMYLKLKNSNADMSIATTDYQVDIPYAILDMEGEQVIGFKEKPSYTYYSNAGIYMMKEGLIDMIPKDEFFDMTDLMDNVMKNGGKIVTSLILGYWLDIGKKEDYEKAKDLVKLIK
jgi:dTDP-glucose pyrophosphorylase